VEVNIAHPSKAFATVVVAVDSTVAAANSAMNCHTDRIHNYTVQNHNILKGYNSGLPTPWVQLVY
jgi:hypothetical protein